MIAEAIEKIQELATPTVLAAHGKSYSTEELFDLASPLATAKALELHTLSGLVDYIGRGFDQGRDGKEIAPAIVVVSPTEVLLVLSLEGEFRQREVLARVTPYLSEGFPFGKWLDQETFVTKLQASFIQDEQTAAVLRVVGNVATNDVATFADDGVTQQVAATTGIQRKEMVTVPNPVTLRPFRTFQELEQPESRFVLRLKRDAADGGLPKAALFEGDDNQWRLAAVNRAREYFAGHLENTPVFA